MSTGFKLSHRLARGFWMTAAALTACVGESPTNIPKTISTIVVTPNTADLNVSDTLQLAAQLLDDAGSPLSGVVTWTSDAEAIATVSASGVVRGADSGTAAITASSSGKSASAHVRVRKPGTPPPPPPVDHAGFFAALSGTASGDGSRGRPWDLATALANPGRKVQPGDTVWVRAGTYRGRFSSTLTGSSSRPIVVRAYPGERVIIDGIGSNATTFHVGGQYSVFWGLELISSDPTRVHSIPGGDLRPALIANYASNTKYINLTIHDGGVGIYNEYNYSNVEITGCIIYNMGWDGSDRGHGHALYLKSGTGPVYARDNIIFNQFGFGVHIYSEAGTGQMNNIHVENNVAFNNGTQSTLTSSSNILYGGYDYSTGGVVKGNYTYESPGVSAKNVRIGYSTTQNGTMQLQDNYFVGGTTVLDVGYWSSLSASSNVLAGTSTVVQLSDPALTMSKFSGQTVNGLPTATKVIIQPSPYEPGRANVVVYNWEGNSSVSLDLANIVPPGATFEIRNVQDYFGSPVVSGTYTGPVLLPIRAVTPPAPIGLSSARSPSTGTVFSAYVVSIRP